MKFHMTGMSGFLMGAAIVAAGTIIPLNIAMTDANAAQRAEERVTVKQAERVLKIHAHEAHAVNACRGIEIPDIMGQCMGVALMRPYTIANGDGSTQHVPYGYKVVRDCLANEESAAQLSDCFVRQYP